jgi:hypothetical protein
LIAVATPEERPPPPTGTTTTSTLERSSKISRPTVPWPAMMSGYGDAEGPAGVGEGLAVVAGGVRDHAGPAVIEVEAVQSVRGAAELERPDRLEALGLQPQFVGPGARQQRGADHEAGDPRGGVADVVQVDEVLLGGGHGVILTAHGHDHPPRIRRMRDP